MLYSGRTNLASVVVKVSVTRLAEEAYLAVIGIFLSVNWTWEKSKSFPVVIKVAGVSWAVQIDPSDSHNLVFIEKTTKILPPPQIYFGKYK